MSGHATSTVRHPIRALGSVCLIEKLEDRIKCLFLLNIVRKYYEQDVIVPYAMFTTAVL